VVRCTACGLTHLLPVPSDVAGMYEQDYFRAYADAGIRLPAESEALPARYVRRLDALSGGRREGRVLDVGSGHGSFLNLARRHGWAVHGIDVSRYAAEQVQQRYGIDVRVGTLEHAAFPVEHFDLIHMSHVLEHLPDPGGTLAEVRRVLKRGGFLAIEVPNELENLGTRVLSAVGLLRPYAVRSTHIWFFSPSTLGRLLSAAGFDLVRLRTFRDTDEPRPIRWTVKQAARMVEEPLGLAPLIELIARKPVAS
jgi:SAM-dependent methyltransferase